MQFQEFIRCYAFTYRLPTRVLVQLRNDFRLDPNKLAFGGLTLEEYIAVAVQTKDLSPDAVSNLGNSNF